MITELSGYVTLSTRANLWVSDCVKRWFDVVVSALLLIMLSPLMVLIAIAVKRESPGPVFFRGERVQKGGKVFHILKFRTMYENAASYAGPRVTAQNDPRITPLGRWLRDTKLNELPQLWNVLKGEMSLVGPRPEDPAIARTWPKAVWDEVLSVRPGITSPASVQYHNEESLLSTTNVLRKYMQELGPDKARLDQLYVRHRSFWLDLDTLLWTVLIFLPRIGATPVPEEILFVGPITRLIRRYVSWFTSDLLITAAAIAFTGLAWRMYGPLNIGWAKACAQALGFAFLFSGTGALMGVNRVSWAKATFGDVYRLLPAWLLATTLALLINNLITSLPPTLIMIASVLALAGFVFVRYRGRLVSGAPLLERFQHSARALRERVLIVGSGRTAEHVAWLLHHPTYVGKFQIVGFIDEDLFMQGMRIYGATIVGRIKDIPQLVKEHDIGLVLLADHRIAYEQYRSIRSACGNPSVKVAIVPDLFGSLNSLLQSAPFGVQASAGGDRDSGDFRCQHCLARHASSE